MGASEESRQKHRKPRDEGDKRNSRMVTKRHQKKAERRNVKLNQAGAVERIVAQYEDLQKVNTTTITAFKNLPLSGLTIKGLDECEYTTPTEIQRDSLPFSLTGADLVGAAKTGSGKTLALVIPLLECLWRAGWESSHGLGALIISPTRELALQTFTCINHVGKYHSFSCALLIGGKGTDVEYEQARVGGVNIIVCTPGRLLQHMDENFHLKCDDLQMLVIDEADRILDMGFAKQINAIIANLPSTRQTLLFSATQTRNVKDLTRVCTKDPVFISVHERASNATPDQLKQSYMVCEEQEKLNVLWSFVTNHKTLKTLVFVSSCKQARYITRAFCHLRPGVPVSGIWGSLNQSKRIEVFQKFENATKGAVMIATDVAGRGLDFSDVDWVIQMDAPATVDDYIHRVGRTARMERKGQAVMFVTERQEEALIQSLEQRNIPLEKLMVNVRQLHDIRARLQAFVAQFPEMNTFAQKSIVSYLRCIYLMRDKRIFDVESIDAAALAESYGLMTVPRVRFLSKKGVATKDKLTTSKDSSLKPVESKSAPKKEEEGASESGSDDGHDKKASTSLVGAFSMPDDDEDANDEDLFTVKSKDVFKVLEHQGIDDHGTVKEEDDDQENGNDQLEKQKPKEKKAKIITKAKAAKKLLNKGVVVNKKTTFDSEGNVVQDSDAVEDLNRAEAATVGLDIQEAMQNMKTTDKADRERARQLRKAKKVELKKRQELEKKRLRGEDADADVDVDFGGEGGGSGDEEGEGPDLSWLVDPDEAKRKHGVVDSDSDSFDEDAVEYIPKERREPKKKKASKKSKKESDEDEEEEEEAPQAKRQKLADVKKMEEAALAMLNPF